MNITCMAEWVKKNVFTILNGMCGQMDSWKEWQIADDVIIIPSVLCLIMTER